MNRDQCNLWSYPHWIPLPLRHDQQAHNEAFQNSCLVRRVLQIDMIHYSRGRNDWRYIYFFLVMILSCLITPINSAPTLFVSDNLADPWCLHRVFQHHRDLPKIQIMSFLNAFSVFSDICCYQNLIPFIAPRFDLSSCSGLYWSWQFLPLRSPRQLMSVLGLDISKCAQDFPFLYVTQLFKIRIIIIDQKRR